MEKIVGTDYISKIRYIYFYLFNIETIYKNMLLYNILSRKRFDEIKALAKVSISRITV